MPHPEIQSKPGAGYTSLDFDQKIAEQVAIATYGDNFRRIGMRTGYSAETTRRYLRADSRIPADFVRQIALQYEHDSNILLCLSNPETGNQSLRAFATDVLINELGRRMKMIENCAMASVMVSSDKF